MNERIMRLVGSLKDISSEIGDLAALEMAFPKRSLRIQARLLFDVAIEIEKEASAGGGG